MDIDDDIRRASLDEYLKNGEVQEYGKEANRDLLKKAYKIGAEKVTEQITNEYISNLKKAQASNSNIIPLQANIKQPEDKTVKYSPKHKRMSKTELKMLLLKIIIGVNVTLGIVGLGVIANNAIEYLFEDYQIDQKVEHEYINKVFAGRTDGKVSYRGEHWYDEDKFVEKIIEKKAYKTPEKLYTQLARIYTGLDSVAPEGNRKINDKHGDGYTPEQWIEKIYGALRKQVLTDFGIEIGPAELMDFLNSIGKLPFDRDPNEVMLEHYKKYKTAIENQVRENPERVVLLPVEEVLEAEFGVVLD